MRDRDWGGFRVGRTKDHGLSGRFGRFRQLRSTKLPNPSEKRTVFTVNLCPIFCGGPRRRLSSAGVMPCPMRGLVSGIVR